MQVEKGNALSSDVPVVEVSTVPNAMEDIKSSDAHHGVRAVEAAEKVYGRFSKWLLFIGIGLSSYITSLERTTTVSYLAFATSAFSEHSLLSAIQVAQFVLLACGQPVIAKFADVTSRAKAFLFALGFYVLGYVIIPSSSSIGAYAAGSIIYTIGSTGLPLMLSVLIADITTLQWRGLVSSLPSTPSIINAFVGSNIAAQVVEHAGWRWGYGMFAILVPVSLLPLVATLLWAENKAKRLGLVQPVRPPGGTRWDQRALQLASQLDLVGLALLGAAVSLILLPLTLAENAKGQWRNASMIAMLVVGGILFAVFVVWDMQFARSPVLPKRFLTNTTVLCGAWIGFFYFGGHWISQTYLYSFVLVVKPWPLVHTTYFSQTVTVTMSVFAIVAGVVMRIHHHYKWMLVLGQAIWLLGVGLMIHACGAHGSDVALIWTQILQGIGGGLLSVAIGTAAQASVTHADVAMVTAMVSLWSTVGGAVGSAVSGAMWSNLMPVKLRAHLPGVPQADRDALFGSITDVMVLPYDDPVRQGVIDAYTEVLNVMVIAATALAVVPLVLSFFMPDWYLGDKQNAVDSADLAGERVEDAKSSTDGVDAAEGREKTAV
ncbi:drug:h+ antiporter [Earliella scabrosa]|nr:drug:h+ antiporter [Earliella scabrosa]